MPARKKTNLAYSYSRKSGPGRNQLSLSGQHRDELLYMERNGLVELEHFEDIGTGLDTDDRDGFLRMIAKALDPANRASHLVFYDLSRFTRSKIDPHVYLELFDEHDITVHTVMDGERSETDDIAWLDFTQNLKRTMDVPALGRHHTWPVPEGFSTVHSYPRHLRTTGFSHHPFSIVIAHGT